MAANRDAGNPADDVPANIAAAPSETRNVALRVDETKMETAYANVFRTNTTPEELLLDFGTNQLNRPTVEGGQAEVVFQVTNRIIMTPYMAKRLAIMLSQLVRQYEEQFGELELDVMKRRKK